jgi:hypothetical protein
MAAASYSCKHLLLCVIALLVVIFLAGMVDAVDNESALRGAIKKAMTSMGCVRGQTCHSNSDCGPYGACVCCALLSLF